MSDADIQYAVQAEGLCKRYGSLLANDHVNLSVQAATIHAIVGENGAGKSTLMNMLYGVMPSEGGTIRIFGEKVHFRHPADALAAGIGMVSQHYALIPEFTVLENLLLTHRSSGIRAMPKSEVIKRASEFVKGLGLDIDWEQLAGSLSVSAQQKVEILRLLMRGCRILIFDEPTAVLPPADADNFYELLHRFTKEGRTAIVVTHHLQEVVQHADRVTLLRMGRHIADYDVTPQMNLSDLANQITGVEETPAQAVTSLLSSEPSDELVVEVNNVTTKHKSIRCGLKDLNLSVRKGEIMGIAGVDGSGQAELVELLVGLRKCSGQELKLNGKPIGHLGVADRHRLGVRYIAEDRYARAVISEWNLVDNIMLGHQREGQFGKWLLKPNLMRKYAEQVIEQYHVKSESTSQSLSTLSGGNQQKLVVGRELLPAPTLLVAGHPTRGLDTQSADFVRAQITAACAGGSAAIVVSYDISELLELCHRVAVLYKGRVVGTFTGNAENREAIGQLMVGVGV